MSSFPEGPQDPIEETPEALLHALRAHPEWDEHRRDEQLNRLVQRFPRERLLDAARERLGDLRGAEGEAVLRLVEAFGGPEMYEALAEALVRQPDLPADRAWEAFSLLEGSGCLEARPELAERWEELAEVFDEEDSLAELAAQIEEEPDGLWLALQGLEAVEPDVRAEIITGLAGQGGGPRLVEFLRALGRSDDPQTRSAALAALGDLQAADCGAGAIVVGQPEGEEEKQPPGTSLGTRVGEAVARGGETGPRLVRSLVTAVDGRGRGYVVMEAEDGDHWVAAAFLCDVVAGVVEAAGTVGATREELEPFAAEFVSRPERDATDTAYDLAAGVLAGSLWLGGPRDDPALRGWLDRTVGPTFQPRPFAGLDVPEGESLASMPHDEAARRAEEVLAACEGWVDDSDLTYELAEEVWLREGDSPPDPRRDSGAYRFLFEHRLQKRLEVYRRMLLWMSAFWDASDAPELARSALALAWQLSDAQHAVPGHPFIEGLAKRSLAVAQANLRRQIDLRHPATRARYEREGRPLNLEG